MEANNHLNRDNEMAILCNTIREFIRLEKYQECTQLVAEAMGKYPHAPQPHNLFGILLEKEGDHLMAMKHFRAAWSLDPTYIPAKYNLDRYGTFFSTGQCAFDESDCAQKQEKDLYKVEYDEYGIGHVIRRK